MTVVLRKSPLSLGKLLHPLDRSLHFINQINAKPGNLSVKNNRPSPTPRTTSNDIATQCSLKTEH